MIDKGNAAWIAANSALIATPEGMKRLRYYVKKYEKNGGNLEELNNNLRLILDDLDVDED